MYAMVVHFLRPYGLSTKLHSIQMPQMHYKITNLTKKVMD
jgi:hypothetical protein